MNINVVDSIRIRIDVIIVKILRSVEFNGVIVVGNIGRNISVVEIIRRSIGMIGANIRTSGGIPGGILVGNI